VSAPRRGLVLGAGGVLGFAWAAGALAALQEQEGFDCRDAGMLVGTSAGSITAALLGCGVPVEAMVRHQSGMPAPGDPVITYDQETNGTGPLPPRPAFSLGSPSLLAHSARHPLTVTPLAALSSVLPIGRGSLGSIGTIVSSAQRASAGALAKGPLDGDRLTRDKHSHPDPGATAGGTPWAPHPSLWVVAMDYDTGKRVAFGRPGSPGAGLDEAVMASCAIPGWYAPISIGGRRYVDGGACSSTSLDLFAGQGLDEVFVVAPMVSFAYDSPAGMAARLERRVRKAITRRLLREAEKVQAAGTRVTMLGPGPEDLATIGANLMDASRRDTVLEVSLRTSADAWRRGADPYALDDGDSTVAS
jgi:NTE family protein